MYPIKNFFIVLKQLTVGNRYYYAWVSFLGLLIFIGAVAYGTQLQKGLIATAMRDQPVSKIVTGSPAQTITAKISPGSIFSRIQTYRVIVMWGPKHVLNSWIQNSIVFQNPIIKLKKEPLSHIRRG